MFLLCLFDDLNDSETMLLFVAFDKLGRVFCVRIGLLFVPFVVFIIFLLRGADRRKKRIFFNL